jgi:hypothetical protein
MATTATRPVHPSRQNQFIHKIEQKSPVHKSSTTYGNKQLQIDYFYIS